MVKLPLKALFCASCAIIASAGQVYAGGLERGGYNIDLLFNPDRFATEATTIYVMPNRKLNNVKDSSPWDGPVGGGRTDGVKESEAYWVPRIGLKVGITDSLDCLLDYSQPWGAHTNPGRNWAGANDNTETKMNSDGYSGTCSYKFDVSEKAQLRLIGGVFYQAMDGFKEQLVAPIPTNPFGWNGIGRLTLEADGWGWRSGVAYEIPEYSLRASLVYNSEVKLDEITGTLNLKGLPPGAGGNPLAGGSWDVNGSAKLPQSVELKMQSGIAPGWLAFGSLKWTDWSVLQDIPFYYKGVRATSLDLLYRDGWTVSAGIGHKFNDEWSGAVQISWDRGTSTTIGNQTDTWTLAGGASYTPNERVELRVGGLIGVLTGGEVSNEIVNPATGRPYLDASYDFDDDIVSALTVSLNVKI
ncbi:OmpP1/FadL family transporter [Brucella anthropi]|uniref:OmpP1/FadL family transporter n=1 Tax=Brucella anthropi TaxID=529 RepID=UPI002164F518|nr:OmpP1/FadL family transporter [Brucella anthropi]MDG9793478.1 OmpP1/FadL family transporter [Brucella anthropi]MDH0583265.1 OmpP1/FadL family transporter [Brucella anthropi]MDH0819879.1 OmpP1/FadL family transporter [Brucella anthropi]MDH2086596.1 OmpP1/FadL family transporter [Brucella anthropi]UVV70863.1 OmpP1/FadL family transporter [Brucella anthropi]